MILKQCDLKETMVMGKISFYCHGQSISITLIRLNVHPLNEIAQVQIYEN